jgi:hypothetical protein
MQIIKPPKSCIKSKNQFSVFLAGSIEMGIAENWQAFIEKELSTFKDLIILNPRRDDWDSSWEQSLKDPRFHEQVSWELDGLENADLVIFYFAPETKSPISMMELGLLAQSGKLMVCCPQGFWRKGNIDVVCERYKIKQVSTILEIVEEIKSKIK